MHQHADSPLHEALLRACLGDRDALLAWEAAADIEAHDAEMGALLPLLHATAEAQGWPLRHAARISGVYRYWFASNQVNLRALAGVVAALAAKHVPVMLLGAPLNALAVYPRPALHPIERLEVLIPPRQQRHAVAALLAAGWVPQAWVDPKQVPYTDVLPLKRDQIALTLRWHAVDYRSAAGIDDRLWARAETAAYPAIGEPVQVPGRADHLLLAALRPPQVWGQPVWLLWRATLLTLIAGGLDWGTLAQSAAHYRLHGVMAPLLNALKRHYAAPIPDEAFAALSAPLAAFDVLDASVRALGGRAGWRAHLLRWQGMVRGLPPRRAARQTAGYVLRGWARLR